MVSSQPPVITLKTSVAELPGVGSVSARRLERLGIITVEDLLKHYPRRHDDLSNVQGLQDFQTFGSLPEGVVTVRADLQSITTRRTRHRRFIVTAKFGNQRGAIEAAWFNQPYLAKQLVVGAPYNLSGKVKAVYGTPTLQNPTTERAQAETTHTGRLVPVYPETEGLSSKWLRAKIKPLLPLAAQLPDHLPAALVTAHQLPKLAQAIHDIHFPASADAARAARRRFDFEQLLVLQLLTQQSRQAWQAEERGIAIEYDPVSPKTFVAKLPWLLTDEQRRAAHEILKDLDSARPMMRLLQGDVGSGKTAVAAVAINQVLTADWQAALMVPTDVLAKQHIQTLQAWFGMERVVLLVGSLPAGERQEAIKRIESGESIVVIGTQALIQQKVVWPRLALAVVDEQHRFGVQQREKLRGKHVPHLLSMSATPIPRSLALVAFGDYDLSLLESRPGNRQTVWTKVLPPSQREVAWEAIRQAVGGGQQAFVVYPVIGETKTGLRSAEEEYAKLIKKPFKGLKVELLHGKLSPAEKTDIMSRFSGGKIDVLVSTSVVEVGIDVPNATVMVVEEAQQFGLAQLHQLRGRVGRNDLPAQCFLLAGSSSAAENARLVAMEREDSGFKLAEIDLDIRGPGDLVGTQQSGFAVSPEALLDSSLLKETHDAARRLLAQDPELRKFPGLRKQVIGAQLHT